MDQIATHFNQKKQQLIQFLIGIQKIIESLSVELQLAIDKQYDNVQKSVRNLRKSQLNNIFQQLQKQAQQRVQVYEQITKQIYAGIMELVQRNRKGVNPRKMSIQKLKQPNIEVSEVRQVYTQSSQLKQILQQKNNEGKSNQIHENPTAYKKQNIEKNPFNLSEKRNSFRYANNSNGNDQAYAIHGYRTGQELIHLNPMNSKSRIRNSVSPNKNMSGISITNQKIKKEDQSASQKKTEEKIRNYNLIRQNYTQGQAVNIIQYRWKSPLRSNLQKYQNEHNKNSQRRESMAKSPSKKYQTVSFPITFQTQYEQKQQYSYLQQPMIESVLNYNPNSSFQYQKPKVFNGKDRIKVTRNHQICQSLDQKIKNQAIQMLRKTQNSQRTKSSKKIKGVHCQSNKTNLLPIHAISHFSPSAQVKQRIQEFERSSYFQ